MGASRGAAKVDWTCGESAGSAQTKRNSSAVVPRFARAATVHIFNDQHPTTQALLLYGNRY